MADTTPTMDDPCKDAYIKALEKDLEYYKAEDAKKQKACVRIYRIFGEDMHACKLNLDLPSRMAWMQKIAQVASIKTVGVDTAVDEQPEISPVKARQATPDSPTNVVEHKKPAKVVGVGQAGEKSGH